MHKALVRLGLMHLVATNICTWLAVVVKEVSRKMMVVDATTTAASIVDSNLSLASQGQGKHY